MVGYALSGRHPQRSEGPHPIHCRQFRSTEILRASSLDALRMTATLMDEVSAGVEPLVSKGALIWSLLWKEAAPPHLRWTNLSPTAEGSWHRASPSDSGREIPGTSSGPPASSRPTFRWAFPCRSRSWPAPAGFRQYDRKSAFSDRARAVWISWRISSHAMCCAQRGWQAFWHQGSWLARNRKTHPAPLREAATRPGVLHSEV